jgi:hypothetical protein
VCAQAAPRVQKLETLVAADKQRVAAANGAMDAVFKGVFIHRAQDADETIRESAVKHFAELVVAHKQFFLHEKYLQQFLNTVDDRDAKVRVAGVRAVATVYRRCVA